MLELLPGILVVGSVPVQGWVLPSQAQLGQELGATRGSFNCRAQKCGKTGFVTSKRLWIPAGVCSRWAAGVDVVGTGMEGHFVPGWRELCPRMEKVFVLGQRCFQGLSVPLGCSQSVCSAEGCWWCRC